MDSSGRPVGVVTRSDLVSPQPRRVLLVDPRRVRPASEGGVLNLPDVMSSKKQVAPKLMAAGAR